MRRLCQASLAVLALALQHHWIEAKTTCSPKIAKELGQTLGALLVRDADAFASGGTRGWIPCDGLPERSQKRERMCAQAEALSRIADRIEAYWDRGCESEEIRYKDSLEFHAFEFLKDGLLSEDRLARWHILARIFGLCENPILFSRRGEVTCKAEVEDACLVVLARDKDSLNRQLALEILRSGYASEKSEEVLTEIARTARDSARTCPIILRDNLVDEERPDLDEATEGYARSEFACEGALASEALSNLGPRQDAR